MERHFSCTACGKCCQGRLPLSIEDAVAHADRFPLFLQFSPVRPGGKSYDITAKMGMTFTPKKRKFVAVRITPISYVPSTMPCPALLSDGLCAVHAQKPQRCKTMPLSAARAEDDQADLLIPAAGWACDVSENAPVVYRDKTIVVRENFETERAILLRNANTLRAYAEFMVQAQPKVRQDLAKMALRPQGGHVIINFSTLLARLPQVDAFDFAAKQRPVMEAFANRTKTEKAWQTEHERYAACLKDYDRMLSSRS